MNARRVSSSRKRSAAERRKSRRQPRHVAARARHGLRSARVEVIGVVAVSVAVLLVLAGSVVAYFGATGFDTATGGVGSLSAPTNVSATQVGTSASVNVTWTASSGTPVPDGYYVTRTTGPTTVNVCGSSPASLLSATSCTDTGVTSGSYAYRVIAVYRSWTATSAPANVSVNVVVIAQPVITNIRPTNGTFGATWAAISCTTNNDRRVCANVTTPMGTTISAVTVQISRASDGRCYDGTGAGEGDWPSSGCPSIPTSGGANYFTDRLFNPSYAEDDIYTFTVTATNNVGGTATAFTTRAIDNALPTGSLSPTVTTTGANVQLTASDLNGIASISYRVDSNAGALTTVTGPGPLTLPTLAQGTHEVDYFFTDNAGRSSATVNNAVVTVDGAAPTVNGFVPAPGTTGATFGDVDCTLGGGAGLRLCANVLENGDSGLSTVTYQLKRQSDGRCYDGSGANPSDWIVACNNLTMAALGLALHRTPTILSAGFNAADTYVFTVTATDNAGNVGTAFSTFILGAAALQAPASAPAGTSSDVQAE
ncbi:fibronectin type III domain-containing protein [Nocardioides sp. WS12]|uniref:fibronectin type III domain-containing protein n=1 Tax=Nocardioides sp. WS12 TaxID=2486272 RepID=UPI0015F834FB|nr:fibronectin type III domain-containing protein [Nocardioides sp. WS12]